MIWRDFFEAYGNWGDDAIERNMPEEAEFDSAPADEVFEVIENIDGDKTRAVFIKNALSGGFRFKPQQVSETVHYLPKDFANELFVQYAGLMNREELSDSEGVVDVVVFTKALWSWAKSDRPITWEEFYEDSTSFSDDDELIVARMDRLVSYGSSDEVFDLGMYWLTDEAQRSRYIDKALSAKVRFIAIAELVFKEKKKKNGWII